MAQSLEELKAENAAAEAAESEKPEEKATEEEAPEQGEEESKTEEEAEEASDDFDEEDAAFMQSEEQSSGEDDGDDGDGEAKFTDSDVAAVRRKYQGRLKAETEEKDEWKEKYLALKAQQGNPESNSQSQPSRMPKLIDFDYDEKRYEAAMTAWVRQTSSSANQEESEANSQAEAQQKAKKALDEHYQRVDELTTQFKISDEVYQKADTDFRQAVEDIIPNAGDTITDSLIVRLGKGAERVIFHLGRNPSKLEKFKNLLREDSSGISASMMLGELRTELVSKKRESRAAKPSAKLNGDASSSGSGSKLKRKYENTEDLQTRINIKREAKLQGIDVSGW